MSDTEFNTADFARSVSESVGGIVGYLERYAEHSTDLSDDGTNQKRGAHPVHGSSHGNNFVVDTAKGVWHCKRHADGSGGGILELIAVDRGLVDCHTSSDLGGAVWTDTLEVAADIADVELNIGAGEKKQIRGRREERARLDETMSEVLSYYQGVLSDDHRRHLRTKYGFDDETIDAAGIGYAPASDDGRAMIESVDATEPELVEAGLAGDSGGKLRDFFHGRIIFPYRVNGNVRYFIGRRTEDTPDWDDAKYRKLKLPADDNPISPVVDEPVYGVDTILGEEELIVTEGITDAIALHAEGFPAIAPVTTQFKQERMADVAKAVSNREVTVVMDEDEDTDAGLLGAVKTAHTLAETGQPTRVFHARLLGQDVDVADYMRSHSAAEFRDSVLQAAVPAAVAWWAHGDGAPCGLFEAAMRENDHPPWVATTRQDDQGDTIPIPVDEVVTSDDIGNATMQFRSGADELSGKQRNMVLADVLWWYLTTHGNFFKTPGGVVHYFDEDRGEVLKVDGEGQRNVSKDFRQLLTVGLDILPDRTARNVFTHLRDRAASGAPERETHALSHYDQNEGVLYVTDFESGYYALDGDRIDHRRNGTDVFFAPDDNAESYEYIPPEDRKYPGGLLGELDANRTYMERGDMIERAVCNRVNFDPHCVLGRTLQYRQLYLHLHTIPFGDIMNGRPIAAFVGEKGSGKTVVMRSIGQLFYGGKWREGAWPADKQNFVVKVTNSTLSFFDNYDDGVQWANDSLASVATGTSIEMRELYTTNDMRRVQPDCWIGITSRDPPFRRDDVADRTLVTRLNRVDGDKVGMGMYLKETVTWRDVIWSDYLENLNEIVGHMHGINRAEYSSDHRMADWAIQARITAEALDIPLANAESQDLFGAISHERAAFALEERPEIQASVRNLLNRKAPGIRGQKLSAGEMLSELSDVAKDAGINLSAYNPRRLGQTLTQYESELDEMYGFEAVREAGAAQNYYRFTTDESHQDSLG